MFRINPLAILISIISGAIFTVAANAPGYPNQGLPNMFQVLGVLLLPLGVVLALLYLVGQVVSMIMRLQQRQNFEVPASGAGDTQYFVGTESDPSAMALFPRAIVIAGGMLFYLVGLLIVLARLPIITSLPTIGIAALVTFGLLATGLMVFLIGSTLRDLKNISLLKSQRTKAIKIDRTGLSFLHPLISGFPHDQKPDSDGYISIPWRDIKQLGIFHSASPLLRLLFPIGRSCYMIGLHGRFPGISIARRYFSESSDEKLIQAVSKYFSGRILRHKSIVAAPIEIQKAKEAA